MGKYSFVLLFTLLCFSQALAQNKREREFRILKKQFPEVALQFLSSKLEGAKRIRFYKEIDSAKISFEAKFKKQRLNYSIEFDKDGQLEDIEIEIKPIDLPSESWQNIQDYIASNFKKAKVRKIQQQYLATSGESTETTLKNAFQNLLLPSVNYELIVSGKREKDHQQFEILFDANGIFKNIRKSLPPNYDHVLY